MTGFLFVCKAKRCIIKTGEEIKAKPAVTLTDSLVNGTLANGAMGGQARECLSDGGIK